MAMLPQNVSSSKVNTHVFELFILKDAASKTIKLHIKNIPEKIFHKLI